MAKFTLPDALKAEVPPTLWSRLLAVTPVVATALAGLASSEMTRAQYSRSLATQQPTKAGDERGFFQTKRLCSALQRNALDTSCRYARATLIRSGITNAARSSSTACWARKPR